MTWETVRVDLDGTFGEVRATVSGLHDLGPMPADAAVDARRRCAPTSPPGRRR